MNINQTWRTVDCRRYREKTAGRTRAIYTYYVAGKMSSRSMFMWPSVPGVDLDCVVVELDVDAFRVVNGWDFVQFILDRDGGKVEF